MFGETVFVEVEGRRGSTDKYAAYLSVYSKDNKRVSEETKFQIKKKKSEFSLLLPVQLKAICKESGEYILSISGMEQDIRQKIPLLRNDDFCVKEEFQAPERKEEVHLALVAPKNITEGEEFSVTVFVQSPSAANMTVYGYSKQGKDVTTLGYDGKKWSRSTTANKQIVALEANDAKLVTLQNKFMEGKEGNYTYTVVAKSRTRHETEALIFVHTLEKPAAIEPTINLTAPQRTNNTFTGKAIYSKKESKIVGKLKKMFLVVFK